MTDYDVTDQDGTVFVTARLGPFMFKAPLRVQPPPQAAVGDFWFDSAPPVPRLMMKPPGGGWQLHHQLSQAEWAPIERLFKQMVQRHKEGT